MEPHELLYVVNDLGRIAQLLHSLAGHPRPDDVVVMKMDPAGTDRTRQGLADVVEERSQAQSPLRTCLLDDGDRMRENVLVPLDRVLLEGERRQLGQELLGQPSVDEEPEPGRRAGQHEQLVELVPDPLPGDDREA